MLEFGCLAVLNLRCLLSIFISSCPLCYIQDHSSKELTSIFILHVILNIIWVSAPKLLNQIQNWLLQLKRGVKSLFWFVLLKKTQLRIKILKEKSERKKILEFLNILWILFTPEMLCVFEADAGQNQIELTGRGDNPLSPQWPDFQLMFPSGRVSSDLFYQMTWNITVFW